MPVYFAQSFETGLIKIGCSGQVTVRVQQIGRNERESLSVIRVIPGDLPEERAVHSKFADLRVRGEWFNYSPEMLTFLPDDRAVDVMRLRPCEAHRLGIITPTTTRDSAKLERLASAKWGRRWRAELRTAAKVDRRTVYRWVSGVTPVPEYVWVIFN